jgi:YegS/Rv2252/BmrU family lipid kinase
MKIVFVANNKNNRLARVLPGLEEHFRNLGRVQVLSTLREKHAIDLARGATENRCDYLIAVGGDGTLHEVINGLMQSNLPTNSYPAIGLLPYGSANDFAKTANISKALGALMDLIRAKSIRKVDLAKIILHKTGEIRYFINIAGVGLGAEVAQNLAGSSSALGAGFLYFKHILKGFLKYSKKQVSCTGSTWQWTGPLLQLAVGNGRYFGHGICIAPDASITDGQFQVVIFGDLSMWDYLKNIRKLKKGVTIDHPGVWYHSSREVLIESDDPCGIEADGEYVGLAPATITILPKVIQFLMPTGVA